MFRDLFALKIHELEDGINANEFKKLFRQTSTDPKKESASFTMIWEEFVEDFGKKFVNSNPSIDSFLEVLSYMYGELME